MSDTKEFLDLLASEGWHFDNPSAECERALKRPLMGSGLSAMDVVGIHWRLVMLHLLRRFPRILAGDRPPQETFELVGLYHVLRQVTIEDDITKERIRAAQDAVSRWHREVYEPANQRWTAECWSVPNRRWLIEHRARYEPVLTLLLLEISEGFVDVERDLRTMARARAMHEQGTLHPNGIVPTSLEELAKYFEYLCDDYRLSTVGAGGAFVLKAASIKTALDGKIGRAIEPDRVSMDSQETAHVASNTLAGNEAPQSALDALAAVETVAAVRRIIATRLREAAPESARWWVLANFEALQTRETSYRALAELSGLSASALQESAEAERLAIAAALKAA